MNKKILSAVLAALMLLVVALPASAAIQATSVEVRGQIANETAGTKGYLDTNAGPVSWNPQNFAGFFYDAKDDLGSENLAITVALTGSRTIQENNLVYTTKGDNKLLKVVEKAYNSNYTDAFNAGLEQFGSGKMSGQDGYYKIVGWQADKYVALKNKTNKLTKLILEQGTATSEKKTLIVGETWDIGGGWTLTANSIDAKATPRQVWLTLSKDGVKKDDKVLSKGGIGDKPIYTYVEKSIGGESDVPLVVAYVDSVFAGATSDMVQLRYVWVADTAVTEVKGSDKFGVFKVVNADENQISMNNSENTVTLTQDGTVDLMGNMKFKVADSSVVRFYPMVDYEIGGPIITVTGTATPTVTGTAKPTGNATATVTAAVTTAAPTQAATAAATTAKPAATGKEPGFEAVFAIAGLLAVAFLVLRQRK